MKLTNDEIEARAQEAVAYLENGYRNHLFTVGAGLTVDQGLRCLCRVIEILYSTKKQQGTL